METWLVARIGPRIDELARSVRAALQLAGLCSAVLIEGDTCFLIKLVPEDLEGAITEADVLNCILRRVQSSKAQSMADALESLILSSSEDGPVVFLDEAASEDWSWTAPELERATICLGVHEDFVEEVSMLRELVGQRARPAQLGPVALHSSACLHLLASVLPGRSMVPRAAVRPTTVQRGSAPSAASARSFRRALPRRQPVRFFLALEGPPLSSPCLSAEAHQAITASCLVSKSVYDERDTRLTLAWPASTGMQAVTVDRSFLGLSETRIVPAESPVLQALEQQLVANQGPLETVFQGLLAECAELSFKQPVAARILEREPVDRPMWEVQEGWPTDAPLFLFLRWEGHALPILKEADSISVPHGSSARSLVVLQHWHTLGILAAKLTPRAVLPSRGVAELLEDVAGLVPQPGRDVQMDTLVTCRGVVAGRVRLGHVLFAECGAAKIMCKEQRIGSSFKVLAKELHVGDTLHCRGYPGLEYQGKPVLFLVDVIAIEPGVSTHDSEQDVLYRDDDFLCVAKPSGKLACEDARHRFERGTALKVEAGHLIAAPDVDTSGLAIYAFEKVPSQSWHRRSYLLLVAGMPSDGTCCAALRPAQGKPKEPAQTCFEVLWRGSECSLLRASVEGCERKAQVRRHMHILGCPVWGDRQFGGTRANVRARNIFGLAKPWCHLERAEVMGSWGALICECPLPADLLRVLRAVGCQLPLAATSPRRLTSTEVRPEVWCLRGFEHGLSISAFVARRRNLVSGRWAVGQEETQDGY